MAVYTSNGTGGGNLSLGSTWKGGVAPGNGNGDVIVVQPGDTVTVDQSWTLGSKSAGVGAAFTLGATSSSSFGTLKVASGVTLTLRGFDVASNTLGTINQYALFQPQAGSTVLGDVAANYASVILNRGRFEPQAGVTFSVPAANVSWADKINSEQGRPSLVDGNLNLWGLGLAYPNIANAAGTGPGSPGDFPVGQISGGNQGFYSFSGFTVNPSTEVSVTFPASPATIATAVNAPGKYAIDYDAGVAYFYQPFTGLIQVFYNYNCLNKFGGWYGWGIVSGNTAGGHATTGNTCLIDGCTLQYMGGKASNSPFAGAGNYATTSPVVLCGHRSHGASGDATTVAYVKNCTFKNNYKWVQLANCAGTATDPILIAGNAFYDASGSTFADGIHFYGSSSSYVKIDSNTHSHRGVVVDLSGIGADCAGLSFTNNTGFFGAGWVANYSSISGARTPFNWISEPDASRASHPSTPGLYIGSNTAWSTNGAGVLPGAWDGRSLNVSGTSAGPALVELNSLSYSGRLGHLIGSYVTYQKNRFGFSDHHGFTGSEFDDTYCTDLKFLNNLFYNGRGSATSNNTASAAIQAGYNHRVFVDNLVVSGNTFDGWWFGAFDFGDSLDVGAGTTLATNAVVNGNIIANGNYAISTYATDYCVNNAHVLECDYNVLHGQATAVAVAGSTGLANGTNSTGFYQGGNKYNRLTSGNRNIPGVALFDASYTTAQAGRTLAYTVGTLGSNHTLAWGAGPAVPLIQTQGTSGGGGLRTIADPTNNDIAMTLAGTVSWTSGSSSVTGSGTSFTGQLRAGDLIRAIGDIRCYKVASIASDTALTLTTTTVDTVSAGAAIRHRADFRAAWLWAYSGTGSGQARCISWASPYVAYSASVASGGSAYVVGDYAEVYPTLGTMDTPGSPGSGYYSPTIVKVTSVGTGGAVTGLALVSGGLYTAAPGTSAVATLHMSGSGSGLTLDLAFGPGYLLVPDLATAVDATSRYTVVSSTVTLSDGAGGTVKATISMTDPGVGCHAGSVVLPTTSQADANIAVAVNHSPTGNPNWAGTFPGGIPTGVATDYEVTSGSSAIGAGTADDAPATDYFGTTRGSPPTIGFDEYQLPFMPWIFGDQIEANGGG